MFSLVEPTIEFILDEFCQQKPEKSMVSHAVIGLFDGASVGSASARRIDI